MPAIDENGNAISMEDFWQEVSDSDTIRCYVREGLSRGFVVELLSGWKASHYHTTEEIRGESVTVPEVGWKGWCT